MTDMRRTLLWVVFTMSLVLLWDAWNKHTGQPSMFGGSPRSVAEAPLESGINGLPGAPGAAGVPAPASPVAAGVPAPASVPGATEPTAVPEAGGQVPAATGPATVTITTDVVRATFDSTGATLVRLELLAYEDSNRRGQPVMLLDQSGRRLYLAQTGLITAQPGFNLPNHLTPMRILPGERELAPGQDELQLSFEAESADGVRLIKTFTFRRGEYTYGVRHEVINDSERAVQPQVYLQLARDGNSPEGESSFYFTFTGPAMYTEVSKFRKIDFKDITRGNANHERSADNGWIAMVQHYFASAWLLPEGTPREFRTAQVAENHFTIAMVQPMGEVAPGERRVHEAVLFAGPQEERRLSELAPGLDLAKDYGWFTILSKPLFWLLYELHSIIGNWGWSIVALVFLLKIAFYWLNAKAYSSMAKMKAVGPRIVELREKLKDKPQLMQQEMMRIYREEKVNPLGGCLPILVQMPFFIALYWVLLSSVEMRGAPWMLWITDLSARDPWFILPILMTLTSLLQVWLNPRPPDPMQAKLMWFMPLAFGVLFFFFPAGLVLYWLTNNILSIAQQWWINKKLGVLDK